MINFFDHKKIYIFDRYPDDILIDDIRYRFKLNKTITKNLLKFVSSTKNEHPICLFINIYFNSSNIPAAPWPVPTHMVTIPNLLFLLLISFNN